MDHFERMDAKNEATIMQKFDHPNIVKCFDIYETQSKYCTVMEHVDGGNLRQEINLRAA